MNWEFKNKPFYTTSTGAFILGTWTVSSASLPAPWLNSVTFPELVKPWVASSRFLPRPSKRRGTKKSDRVTKRGLPLRTKSPPPTQSPVLAGVLLTWGGAASPGSGRPWLRGPRASALGHASGSVPPGALRAAAAGPRSLGRCVTWAGSGRASQPRVTLYLRLAGSAGCRDERTSGDPGLSEGSAKQPALAARSSAHCLSPA